MNLQLVKILRLLPYQDMVDFAEELSKQLPSGGISTDGIAAALSRTAAKGANSLPVDSQETALFKKIFTRKRSITIRLAPSRKAFVISTGTLQTGDVIGEDLRVALQKVLDAAVTAHVISGGK